MMTRNYSELPLVPLAVVGEKKEDEARTPRAPAAFIVPRHPLLKSYDGSINSVLYDRLVNMGVRMVKIPMEKW